MLVHYNNNSDDDLYIIFKLIREFLSNGCAVVYAVNGSSLTILQKMGKSGILQDAEDHVQSGALTIVDGTAVHSLKSQLNATNLADSLFSTALDAQRRSSAKRVVMLCYADTLLENGDYAKQIEFEHMINHKFEEDRERKDRVKVICCYNHTRLQNKLDTQHLIPLVTTHGGLVDRKGNYNKWYPTTALEIIKKGLEKSLDRQTAELIFKTFKLVYKIDSEGIVANPALFEETLHKIVGNNAADAVLACITEEVKKQMMIQ